MSARDGGPAFPRALPTGEFPPDECLRIINQHAGMSLRDYFAAKALGGMLANTDDEDCRAFADGILPGRAAENAYIFADAMLAAREAKP